MLEGQRTAVVDALAVRVPASTSNLGPGFDLCGLALSLLLEVRATPIAGATRPLELDDDEAASWPTGSDNLLLTAFEHAHRALGGARAGLAGFRFGVRSQIPIGRGLGSSAAAIVAGLLLGAAYAPRAVSREQLLAWALELEGHPDNVTPAMLGGCTLAVPRASGPPLVVPVRLHPALGFALAWPEQRLLTTFARALLPASVPFADAVENPRRLALLVAGLERGDPELLHLGGEDRLHVHQRLPHIAGGQAALEAARAAGAWLATISGGGSALFAIGERRRAEAIASAMAGELERASGRATGRVVDVVVGAPRVEPA